MSKWIKNRSFAGRIYGVCAMTLILPMLAMGGIIIFQINNDLYQSNRKVQQDYVRAIADGINEKALMVEECALFLNNMPLVHDYLCRDFVFSAPQVLALINQVYPMVFMVQDMHRDIVRSITVYSSNETHPEVGAIFQNMRKIIDPEVLAFIKSDKRTAWLFDRDDPYSRYAAKTEFYEPLNLYLRKIYASNRALVGIVAVGISNDQLFPSPNGDYGNRFELLHLNGGIPGGDAVYQHVAPLDLTVVMSLSTQAIRNQAVVNFLIFIAVLAIALGLTMYIVKVILNGVFRRLNLTVGAMERVAHGKFGARIEDEHDDEISRMIGQFNRVLALLENTVTQLLGEERHRQDAQLVALQHQIDPHFIYNSLYLLQLSIEKAGLLDISNSITWFANILHYNIGDTMFATFAQEIEHIGVYLKFINTFREAPIALETNIEGGISEQSFLRFVFQPLVENAIKYGGERTTCIVITVAHRGGQFYVDVENNGEVISDDAVENINRVLNDVPAADEPGRRVGLHNIARRLMLFYHARAGIYLSNDRRTCVHIFFPDDEVNADGRTFDYR